MKLMFNVCHQTCMRQDVQNAVADSVNYLTAKFTFETEDWNATTKTAVFKNGPLIKNIILDANNECIVPAEVIDANYLYVSVFGVKETNYRITTNFAMVQIDKSGFAEGDGAAELTPSLVEQLEAAIAEKTGPNDFKTINGEPIVGTGNIVIQGGGSSVIANPTGQATAQLNKLEIDGVIYEGMKGDPGDDYVLTAQDKADIADLVLAELPVAEEIEV